MEQETEIEQNARTTSNGKGYAQPAEEYICWDPLWKLVKDNYDNLDLCSSRGMLMFGPVDHFFETFYEDIEKARN